MAGHSQFKNIMYRKGAQDAKRAKQFAKITREIIVAVKSSGFSDASMNPRLRAALSLARAANMPKDNIDRAIKKAMGSDDTSDYQEVRYEGYGPNGIAVIVEGLTDNRNRTASEVRSTFSKYGGNLGESGSVSFMFNRIGSLRYAKGMISFDQLFDVAANAGADNVEEDGDVYEVVCEHTAFSDVRDALINGFGDPQEAGIVWRAQTPITIDDEQIAKTLLKLIDVLEDNDDIQNVFAAFELNDALIKKLSEE